MKKILLIALPILLILSGCTVDPTQQASGSEESLEPGSLPVEPDTSDIIAFERGKEGNQKDKDGNEIFKLDEFDNVTFVLKTTNGFNGALFVNDTEIESSLSTSMYIFASDINNDGYREIVFDRNKRDGESAGNYFVVYDVKNMKVLLDESTTKERSHYNYRFNYGMIEDKLTFYPYLGNYSESTIVDYGYLRYSVDKGCYFEYKNIFAITSIDLVSFYINDANKTPVEAVNNVYTFRLNTKYCMEYKVNRTNTDRQLMNSFLSVFWDNDHPSHFATYQPSRTENDPSTGKYVDEFSVVNECEQLTWEFFFGEFGFNVNYKVEA